MCGIYGFAKQEQLMTSLERHKLRGMVMDLAYQNQSRGRDGTGLALLSRTGSVVFKEATPSSELLKTERFQKVIRMITESTQICLGHTRLATIGSVKNRHCHPFQTDDYFGVHNGHFMNREELLKEYQKTTNTPVDSEAIFRVLDGESRTGGIVSKLSKMEGDFALGFARKSAPHVLYLVHNSERPLHVAYVTKLKTLFWSSDGDHLKYALVRNHLKASVWEIKTDHLYTADVRNFNGRSNMKKTVCKMESYAWEQNTLWDEDDFHPDREPRLFSYEELDGFGCFQNSGLDERSKIPCAQCRETSEAGKLFYEEMSGQFLCEDCSFDYVYNFEERRNKTREEELHQLEVI